MSTLEFTRTFVRESGTADRYVPQICPVNLSIQRGSNLALLGKANLTINGEENGATSISVPIDPVNIREKSTVKKLKNKATMSQNNKSVKVKGDRFRFQLERTAMLRVSVQVFEDDEASMPSVECALIEETADEADTAILSVDIAGSQRPPGQEILHPTKEVHTSTQRDAVFVAAPPPDEYQGDVYIDNESTADEDDPIRTPSVVHHFAVAYCEPGSCPEDFYCKPVELFEDDDGGSCSDSDESMMTSIDDELMEDMIRAYRSQLRTSRRKRKKSKSRSSGLRRRWSSDSSSSLTSRSSFYRLCCTLDRIPEEVGVEYDERQDSSLEYDDYAGCILENEELISSMASLTIQPSADKVDASDLAAKGASVFEDEASMPSIDGTLDETADEADIAILSADNEGSQRPPGQEILLPKKEVYPSSQRAVFLATAAQEILLPTTIKILFALPFSMSFPREQ